MPMIQIDIEVEDIMNSWAEPVMDDRSRYLVLYGGAGSGKSVAAAQKLIIRMLEEEKHKFLVVRKVAKTIRNSVYSLLRGTISDWGLSSFFKINKSDMDITCDNGNQIIFAGLDDVEKLKSIHGITGIWLEEASEMLQEDFQQLDLRLRGYTRNYKQIIISFNPISITHWLKRVFFDLNKPDSTVIHTTYLDNKFIDADYSRQLEGLKHQDPYYYRVYALGEWGLVGKTVFNSEIVTDRIMKLREHSKVLKRGNFVFEYRGEKIIDSSIRFTEDENGYITLYELPQKRAPYVIGGDIAEGGHDSSCGQVLNNITGNQAAVWHGKIDTDLYAKQMYCLGRYYNNALAAIEVNFDLHPVKELQRLNYPRQFKREQIDDITKQKQHRYGFMTTKVTRPVIIAELVEIVRESIELINDIPTLEEMLTFARNDNGKPEALEGSHDDRVLALAIAHNARSQQTMVIEQEHEEYEEFESAFGRTAY